jgi:hypothetical protein
LPGGYHTLRKRTSIISKVKSKYWLRTHKYGIRIPKTVEEALLLDQQNNDREWWNAINREMVNVRPAFEEFEGSEEQIPVGYQRIDCHMIFDIKLSLLLAVILPTSRSS